MKKLAISFLFLVAWSEARAVTNIFFNPSQTAPVITSNINAVTLHGDDLFAQTVDGYWSSDQGTNHQVVVPRREGNEFFRFKLP